ncbi:MAG: PAS domain S-box protein [Deltaproteobacteria bacterium]|nr:PAS domain S-box protein [Deltaproteobacteria bacterium]
MPNQKASIINIAIVGGGKYCKELLEKGTIDYKRGEVNARFVAVADTETNSPGMLVARKMNLLTVSDYHKLYSPEYEIHLIVILTPEQDILEDILATKPGNIRALSYHAFELFWKAIAIEEQKLRARNEEIETILNGIQDFIVVITPEMDIVEVNDAFLEKMGYLHEEVIGKKCHKIFQGLDQQCSIEAITCPLNDVIKNKRPHRQVITRINRKGDPRYIEVSTFPVWEKDGKISKFVEISRDITKRKKDEEEITRRLERLVEERTKQLKETHDKLLHQDKMASLGKLSASVVHEINNPIAGVLNLTKLMKRIIDEEKSSMKNKAQFNQYLDLMETETERISRIVSNLLAFSRQSRMELRKVNINQLIEKILFLNSNLLKINRVKVVKSLNPDVPDLIGSEDQLQQVFMNFVSNGVEAIEVKGKGSLYIETNYSLKDNEMVVSFRDTGIGIPMENRSRLFEPFFTTKKKGKGVGLGLSVAYGIIQEHGGSISLDYGNEAGTSFIIRLPLFQSHNVDGGPNGGD